MIEFIRHSPGIKVNWKIMFVDTDSLCYNLSNVTNFDLRKVKGHTLKCNTYLMNINGGIYVCFLTDNIIIQRNMLLELIAK